jgi:hypothetical protein
MQPRVVDLSLDASHTDNLRGIMNLGDHANHLAAEARARVLIDRQLTDAGWSVQDSRSLNLFAAQGVARREATMATGHGRADYLLYVDQRVVGVIEAKPEGTPLSGVECQSAMYAKGLPADVRLAAQPQDGRLPISHGLETAQRRAAALRRSLLAAAFFGRLTGAASEPSQAGR